MSKFIQDPEPLESSKRKEREDIWVSEKEEVLPMPECLKKLFGFEDREFWEDSLENTENKEK